MVATALMADLAHLPRPALESMAEAGREILECRRALAKTGDNIVAELLRAEPEFFEWDHYPVGDVYDGETHSQYYYHAHPPDARDPDEHGHFHTFLRPKGMPADMHPLPVPGWSPPTDENGALCHLVAISMDRRGDPYRLFTVNRWVTGETWYRGADVVRMLDLFAIDQARPSWPVNRWITAMVCLFKPQIASLVTARDRRIAAWRRSHPEGDVFEDRRLEIAAAERISVEAQIAAVEAALAEERVSVPARTRPGSRHRP